MRADNGIYDRMPESWWDEEGVLGILRTAVNPVRSEYFRRILAEKLVLGDLRGLDVGSGGGILSEDLASLGYRVLGIDLSRPSLRAAQKHARQSGIDLAYVAGRAERLPFRTGSLAFATCCDVLEHVDDLRRVIAEVARVLRPGGLFLYDTVNRTLRSNVVAIRFAQEWRWSSFLPPGVHSWRQFIRPRELISELEAHGIEHREVLGMGPAAHPLRIALLARRLRRGRISYRAFGEAIRFRLTSDLSVSYLGYGVRR